MRTVLGWLIGIPVALLLGNGIEWCFHKYVLHGPGKRRRSFWNFHWTQHHREAQCRNMRDADYEDGSLLAWNSRTKELAALTAATVVWVPVAIVARGFVQAVAAGLIYAAVRYCYIHRRAHRDPEWARKRLPWHVDHHLGPNPDANWGITSPWFDIIMGTRELYIGTTRESADRTTSPGHGSTRV